MSDIIVIFPGTVGFKANGVNILFLEDEKRQR